MSYIVLNIFRYYIYNKKFFLIINVEIIIFNQSINQSILSVSV